MKRIIGFAVALAVGAFPANTPAQQATQSGSLIVVGDPQLHNYLGGQLFQTGKVAARFIKVAQRYPEMNLLGGYAFDEGVGLAATLHGADPDAPIVLLGDGMNAACTGEYERLMDHVGKLQAGGRIFLWAHGNHDTYMVGTTNTFPPSTGKQGAFDTDAFKRMQQAATPVDAAYWKPGKLTSENAWSTVCHDGKGGLPMNKSLWMARYLATFGQGITVASNAQGKDVFALEVTPAAGSDLAARDFRAKGKWYPPPKTLAPMQGIYRMYDSYLVQAIDIGDTHRLILIDTSTCGGASLTLQDNAGSHGCITRDQIQDIRTLSQTKRTLIYGGHYHVDEMRKPDRRALLEAFNEGNRKWTYLSAHTHSTRAPTTRYRIATLGGTAPLGPSAAEPRYEFNVGSTTDWPMHAHLVRPCSAAGGVCLTEAGVNRGNMLGRDIPGRDIAYVPAPFLQGREVCRHLDAARALAEMDVEQVWHQPWQVRHTASVEACRNDPLAAQQALAGHVQTIDARMSDPSYREAALAIMRAASRTFSTL